MIRRRSYQAPRWLRNPHLQSLLTSSAWRRAAGVEAMARTGAATTEHVIDAGDGVRLLGFHSHVPDRQPRGLVLLLHGWEGSSDSSYMRLTSARLLSKGFEVFRLNFRDHGDSHHLNEGLFHSCRLQEVLNAARWVAANFPARPLLAAGYSLGGNFALRLALAAPEVGLPLLHDFDDSVLAQGMRGLTEWLVKKHTDLGGIEDYFDGYAVNGGRLAQLQVPVSVLTAADDPLIPVETFRDLQLPAHSTLEIADYGGHCGFIEGASLRGYAERWVAKRLLDAVNRADRAATGDAVARTELP